jgi:methionine synthase II (cobalamin-independent)
MNRVIEGVNGIRIGIHICRGNWSKKEEVLLSGDYQALLPALERMKVSQFVLEYATPRAGDIDVVGKSLANRELGLGVANPRTDQVETMEQITQKVEQALRYYRPEQIFLNTDCGFGCFANRSVNVEETAYLKIKAIAEAAKHLRERFG